MGVALAAFVVLALAAPAEASTDAFDITVTHDASATDHVVVVSAITGTGQIGPQTLHIFLRSDLDDQLRPLPDRTGVQVDMVQLDPQTARQVAILPSAGEWIVLPFADLSGDFAPIQSADEFPIISFSIPWTGATTRIRAPAKSSSPWPLVAAAGAGAVVAGLLVVGLFRFSDRRRPRSAVVVGTDDSA
jgi:hypothetical protein